MTGHFKRLVLVPVLILLWSLLCANSSAASPKEAFSAISCVECHEGTVETFRMTFHGRAMGEGYNGGNVCEACHGSGKAHAEDMSAESIVSFKKDSAAKVDLGNDACLKCHSSSDEVALWEMSGHSQGDISCAECHSVHTDPKPHANPSDSCLRCHMDIQADIRKLSHHPINENKVSCNDCHNSHGTMAPDMVRTMVPNELCYKCHAEKRGPFIWEHAPVEEDCSICHDPHGSNNGDMLKNRVSTLCQNCHTGALHTSQPYDKTSGFGSTKLDPGARLLVGRSCMNCHVNIHGSMNPGHPFLMDGSGQYFNR